MTNYKYQEYPNELKTKFGIAKIYKDYYIICSSKEGNLNKRLHRLIYEDFWGVKLPSEIIIHHKNGNKLDTCILNLEAMEWGKHTTHHWTGKKHTFNSRKKMSDSRKGLKLSIENNVKLSQSKNTVGYFRVTTQPCPSCNQGYVYVYKYLDSKNNRKSIVSVDLNKLKKKVLLKGLEWRKFDDL